MLPRLMNEIIVERNALWSTDKNRGSMELRPAGAPQEALMTNLECPRPIILCMYGLNELDKDILRILIKEAAD